MPAFRTSVSEADRVLQADPAAHLADKLETLAVWCLQIGLFCPDLMAGGVVAVGVTAGMSLSYHSQFRDRIVSFKKKLKTKLKTKRNGWDVGRYGLQLPVTQQQLPASFSWAVLP